ncbi:hypothetical protein AeNC1_000222 [Aphanomyces euteiches]|nr:hypothetical protein AeNC1_000222 [Aphanomyces euteiches]
MLKALFVLALFASTAANTVSVDCGNFIACNATCFDPAFQGCCNGTIFAHFRPVRGNRVQRQRCCLALSGDSYVAPYCVPRERPPPQRNTTISPMLRPIYVILLPPIVVDVGNATTNDTIVYPNVNLTTAVPATRAPTTTLPVLTMSPTTTELPTTEPPTTTKTTTPPATTTQATLGPTVSPSQQPKLTAYTPQQAASTAVSNGALVTLFVVSLVGL